MAELKFKIKGMHCKSCSMLIADALEDIGVENSKIDPVSGQAAIRFDEKKVTAEKIKKTITAEGYKVE
ncbi:MAG TPA: heavy-metal-associated domain-containing protein [Candidatus Nanoarchaeia archaeon]|nr:heavy-metal-associated domain-containing protein [Candidatus Nanoarchaeia archaeon]